MSTYRSRLVTITASVAAGLVLLSRGCLVPQAVLAAPSEQASSPTPTTTGTPAYADSHDYGDARDADGHDHPHPHALPT